MKKPDKIQEWQNLTKHESDKNPTEQNPIQILPQKTKNCSDMDQIQIPPKIEREFFPALYWRQKYINF